MPAVGKKRQRKESSENSNKRQKTNSTEDNTKSTTKATRSTKNSNKQSEQPKQPTRKSSRTIKPTKKTSKQSTKPKQPTRKSLRTKKPVQRESFVTDESIEKLFENDMDTDDSELESEIVSEFLEKQTSHKSTQTKQVKSFNKFVDLHRNMQAAFFNMHGEQVTVDTDFLRNKNSYQSIEINEDNGTSNDGVREYHTVDSDEDTPVEDEVENSDEDVAENTNNGKTCFPDDFFQCGDGVKPKDKVMSAFLHGTGFRTKLLDHILECTNNRKSCVAEKKIQYLKDVNKGKKILIQTIKRTLTGTDANETDDETDNETVTESDSSGASMDIIGNTDTSDLTGNTDTNDIDNGTVVESDSSEASMDITVAESADKADDNGNVDNNTIKKGRGRPRKQQAASPRNRNPDKNNISTQVESIGYFSLSRMSKKDFFFLNACFSADIDFLVNLMEESISEIYKHSADLAPDETMLPSKILKNCHHMFIRGKPHPNGILCTSMADRNKIMLALRPRRRTKKDIDVDPNRRTKEDTTDQEVIEAREKDPAASTTTTELIISMTNRIQENDGDSFVVVDSLYGSYDLLTKLEEKNIGAIAKCRVDRPRAIFEPLVKIIAVQGGNSAPKVGDYATMTAKLPNGKPFTAFSIITKKKSDNKFTFAHLLSTKHLNSEIGISGVSSRMVEEKGPNQNYKEEVALKYVGVLSDYNRCSPFIDNVNDKLVNNLPTFRSTRWICKFTSAVQANVSRFVPTEYGCHTRAANFGDCVLLDCKKRFQEKLLSSGIQWTLIYPGGFHDYFLPNLRYWDKITTFGDLDIPIYTHAVDDIGRIIARIITDSRTVNKCVQLDYYSLTQNKMLQLLKEYYPDANFEYEHYSPEKILELRESSGDSITAKKGAESDRERWGLNYVIYVLGKLACFTEETLRASELYPDYNPKKPEESLSDKEFVFGKQ